MKKIIAPSLLSADFARLGEEVRAIELAGADWVHFDVMDGHFVPNITIGPLGVEAVRRHTSLPIDVHLMIEHPEKYIEDFVKAGANWVSVHAEEGYHVHRTVQLIHSLGAKAGVAVNPATSLSVLDEILPELDYVLLMTVNPGFGGQSFIESCKNKIKTLKQIITDKKLSTLIQIDGGVKLANIAELSALGADVFVAGSAIFSNPDYAKVISEMKRVI